MTESEGERISQSQCEKNKHCAGDISAPYILTRTCTDRYYELRGDVARHLWTSVAPPGGKGARGKLPPYGWTSNIM